MSSFEKNDEQWFDEIERESRSRRRATEPASLLSKLASYAGGCISDLRDNFSLPQGAELKHVGLRIL